MCANACAKKPMCSAVEYYQRGWDGSRCFHMLTGMVWEERAMRGSKGKLWRDAVCYTKNELKVWVVKEVTIGSLINYLRMIMRLL